MAGVSLEQKVAADPQREAELGGLAGALGIGIALPSGGADADSQNAGLHPVNVAAELPGRGTAAAPSPHWVAAADDVTALEELVAPVKGDPAAMTELLNRRDEQGRTPWHFAASNGALTAVRWLAKHPAVDTAAVTDDEMQAHAIHLCIIGSSANPKSDHFQVLHFLLAEKFATVHLRDAQKCTALIVAAQHGNCLCAHLLIRSGADISAVDEAGDTALHWAAYKGHDDVCRIILDVSGTARTLNERTDSFGQTPLHLASLRGNVRAAMALIEGGANIGERDGQGKRPIDLVREKCTAAQEKLRKDKKADLDRALLQRQRQMVHFLEPTWASSFAMAQDRPYYVVLFATAIAMIGYMQVMLNTPHWMGKHLLFLFLQSTMHVTWQIAHRTDPGTFGLREESVS
eukprot:COSAG02_NODE_398_length_23118_cov_49.968939_13_plen_403_part_00